MGGMGILLWKRLFRLCVFQLGFDLNSTRLINVITMLRMMSTVRGTPVTAGRLNKRLSAGQIQ